ncbi:MAG: AgmX/PglI C-terminal domain-containing protein [Sulfurifustaceae bacterium]
MSAIPKEQQTLQARIAEARDKIAALEKKQRAVEHELEGLAGQQRQYQLLEQVCSSLDQLNEMDAGSLFWGDHLQAGASYVKRARSAVVSFNEKIGEIEQRRQALKDRIQDELDTIADLTYEIDEQRREQEEQENEFVVNREIGPTRFRPMLMPWHAQAEDERRFRRSLSVALLVVLMLGIATKIWVFPPRAVQDTVEIPKQLVRLVQEERPKPVPPPVQEKLPEKSGETPKGSGTETAKATKAETQQARAKAERSGVLAFKAGFAELMQEPVSLKLGADARISTGGQQAAGNAERSIVVAQAREGSGGINTATLSRGLGSGGNGNGGSGGGSRVGGVQFTRVATSIGGGNMKGADRPLSDGPGPSRTDEEIQIVFDRYKATLYRIYNHELRSDPTLRGKMVLRITIEPSGEVSACSVESTDMASAALKAEVVERVKRFNFGPKENVARITILYPIDFLPAT